MERLMILLALLAFNSKSVELIYDRVQSENPTNETILYGSCVIGTLNDTVSVSAPDGYTTESATALHVACGDTFGSFWVDFENEASQSAFDAEYQCTWNHTDTVAVSSQTASIELTKSGCYNSAKNGTITKSANASSAYVETSSECPPSTAPTYEVMHDNSSGVSQCYDPDLLDLSSFDVCGYGGDSVLPVGSNTASSVCSEMADGSQCAYALSSDGTHYAIDPEGPNCFDEPVEAYDPTGSQTPTDTCVSSGSLLACPATYEESCPNGVCESGCGFMPSLDGSGSTQFVCIGSDTDGDGVIDDPEVTDPDDETETPDVPEDIDPTDPVTGQDYSSIIQANLRTEAAVEESNELLKTQNEIAQDTREGIGEINNTLDKLLEETTDMNEALNTTEKEAQTGPSDGVESFFETSYPEGFEGIWATRSSELQSSGAFLFIEQFKLEGSGSVVPWQMCFDLGFISFGCHSLEIEAWILAAIKVFILISAAFLCRALIFGG